MLVKRILLTLVSAAGLVAAAADPEPEPATPVVRAAEPATPVRAVKPRQTSQPSLLSALNTLANAFGVYQCVPYAIPLITTLPSLPKGLLSNDLINQALSQTTLELSDVCSFSITGTVGDTYTSFLPTWYSWYNAHTSTLQKIISHCTSATALVSTVEGYETCPQVPKTTASQSTTGTATAAGSTAAGSTAATPTPPNFSSTSTATTAQDASAPRETGFMAVAAAAAAGLVCAVAAL
ncbi:hypothetical protein GGR56DRAFT_636297 [Xylariaceae sp. FL0804]|nr:hypothetical protein GGR56DRAFT_636297 [Xylariaceae sp. FL0804]